MIPKEENPSPVNTIPWSKRIAKGFPAIAFLAGFLWDSVTLGRVVQTSDLWILSAYWVGAFVVLVLLGRNPGAKWQGRLTWIVQFCFGSIFSALVVCYFRSSGTIFTLLFVVILVGILLANEMLQDRYSRLGISWSIFCLSGTMYLNFLVPHLVHGLGGFWFILSVLLGFLPVYFLWRMSARKLQDILSPAVVSLGILGFWMLDLIPPVPLVMKQNLVCKAFEKISGDYTCLVPEQNFLERFGLVDVSIHQAPAEKIYVLSSVFAPSEVAVELEHHWLWLDEYGNWVVQSTVPFSMLGGRASGWRVYSNKQALRPGYWKVETAVKDGAVVGLIEFQIPEAPEPEGTQYIRKKL
jgi:hypothetical protein